MSISRRRFLRGLTATAGAAALGACATSSPDAPGASGSSPPGTGAGTDGVPSPIATAPGTGGTLVVITLVGGNDALNTVVPVGDPTYAARRAALALDPATTHDIGDGFALHPELGGTKALWDAGRVAVVHGVGFDGLDRSHFHCMDVWQAAGSTTTSGWIGRWLDATSTDPLDAIAVGRQLPLLARGERRSAAVVPTGSFALPGDRELRDRLTSLIAADDGRPPLAALVASSTADLLTVVDTVSPVVGSAAAEDPDLRARLATVADLVEAGLPTRVYATELGGFDTHAAQPAQHATLLRELDTALATFLDRVADRNVTVVVYSEFGRRVVPNASDGTDHGRAGTILLAGAVRGGHHGDPPPLDDLVDGDLRTTVDYRAVYGGLLEGVLGVPAGDVIDGAPAPLVLV
jgi:uncharacterized protein (DUF1501 family)